MFQDYQKQLRKILWQSVKKKGNSQNVINLKKIPRLGAKTYEQCIGFLRILEGEIR